jgi:hypothetical protein
MRLAETTETEQISDLMNVDGDQHAPNGPGRS